MDTVEEGQNTIPHVASIIAVLSLRDVQVREDGGQANSYQIRQATIAVLLFSIRSLNIWVVTNAYLFTEQSECQTMRKESTRWWQQALEDLKAAEENLKSKLYYVCAFFSQQAAEKALKALYIEVKREPQPRTHDLTELGEALKVPADIMDSLIELNPEFVITRYPDAANGIPAKMYNERIASSHYEEAKKVVEWVRERLKTR